MIAEANIAPDVSKYEADVEADDGIWGPALAEAHSPTWGNFKEMRFFLDDFGMIASGTSERYS